MSELNSNYYINLDTHQRESQCFLSMMQGDSARKIHISFSENGSAFDLSNVCRAIFLGTKSDGTKLYNSCDIEENTVIYDITPQTTATVGIVECQIQLMDESARTITSPGFSIVVERKTVSDEELQSTNEFGTLTHYISMLDKKIADLNRRLEAGEFKGAAFTYDDFTAEQLEALKVGAVNVSDVYNANSHQAQSGIAISAALNILSSSVDSKINNAKTDLSKSLIKYGVIDNWRYEKHPNGYIKLTQIYTVPTSIVCNKEWNSMYYGDAIQLPNYPFVFDEEPNVLMSFLGSSPELTAFISWEHKREALNVCENPGDAYLYRPVSGNIINNARIGIVAEGKFTGEV